MSFSSSTVFSSPLITRSVHGTFSAPGICPRRRPGRGSSAAVKPGRRTGIDNLRRSFMADQQDVGQTLNLLRIEPHVEFPSATSGIPCSSGSSSRRQPSSPPARIDTFYAKGAQHPPRARGGKQIAFVIDHQMLIAADAQFAHGDGNASARGIICGSGLVWSDSASISKNSAFGTWPARYSAAISRRASCPAGAMRASII